jgi:hypothetical protein
MVPWVVRTGSGDTLWVAHWEAGAVLESPKRRDAIPLGPSTALAVASALAKATGRPYVAERL